MGNVFSRIFPRADTLIVRDRIGRGGYGEVFRGTLGSRPVAVKKIYDILIDAARENRQALDHIVEEFRRECELLKAAKHPNVVDIAAYDRHSNKWSTVGQLLQPRARCTAVSLSRRSFLVCGGLSDTRDINTRLSSVEVVSVQ